MMTKLAHDKTDKTAKTQISLDIRPVWSEFPLSNEEILRP